MMDMDAPYLHTGRTSQKARTRDALIAAARQLLAEGVTPTLEEAAAEASIGRTTAYRYFPNSRALLAATFPEIAMRSMLGADPPDDPVRVGGAGRRGVNRSRGGGPLLPEQPGAACRHLPGDRDALDAWGRPAGRSA